VYMHAYRENGTPYNGVRDFVRGSELLCQRLLLHDYSARTPRLILQVRRTRTPAVAANESIVQRSYTHKVHPNKSPVKTLEKMERGRI